MTNGHVDVLTIVARLKPMVGNASLGEIHLFAYLACLISVYSGKVPSDWGYSFAVTTAGSPFSPAVQDSIQCLQAAAGLSSGSEVGLTRFGADLLPHLEAMEMYADRLKFLGTAVATLRYMPAGIVRTALLSEPGIRRAELLERKQLLLGEAHLSDFLEDFEKVNRAIGVRTEELIVPATVWLSLLSKQE